MLTPEQIKESNPKIAKFMELSPNTDGKISAFDPDTQKGVSSELVYHSNWNWIIPVVEKIESIHDDFHGYFGVHISSNSCTIQGTRLRLDPENPHYAYFSEYHGETKIEAVWLSIINFINWYNTQNFKNESK